MQEALEKWENMKIISKDTIHMANITMCLEILKTILMQSFMLTVIIAMNGCIY